ncbi:MAG: hypothetical protein LWX83_15190, partial [Anaerolineae bacterium]|nr:hypothetical protein [Anaerolineae bacterium]
MNNKNGLKAFCVHGHFYQPPREDPLTGNIPLEPGAAPYSNWNERIHDQCYRPNAELGNFEHISFNVGPTLAQWMADYYLYPLGQTSETIVPKALSRTKSKKEVWIRLLA